MSKIVQAVNAMLSNSKLITDVMANDHEYFFLYKSKYKWSVRSGDDGSVSLWFYPGSESLQEIMYLSTGPNWENVSLVHYSDKDIGTKEARSSFIELYNLVKEKLYGVDNVLDDIISDLDEDLPF